MQTQHARLFRQGPLSVFGDVIPLPKWIELVAIEVVVMDKCRLRFLVYAGVWFDPGIGRFAKIAWQADEGEFVVPSDRHQSNHSSGAAVVGHDDTPPLAGGRIAHTALMEPQAAVVGLRARGCRAGHAQ